MAKELESEIVLRDDGFYEVKILFPKDRMNELIRQGYHDREWSIHNQVTGKFAKLFVEKHFDELSKLIDLETVKVLATRKLANIVAKNET